MTISCLPYMVITWLGMDKYITNDLLLFNALKGSVFRE